MTPQEILGHCDVGQIWPHALTQAPGFDVTAAYQSALAVRELRIARGERPRGFKIGFTNRNIWPIYKVFAPIWGTVYETTLTFSNDSGTVSLANACQPRIEPEAVFGMKTTPVANASLDDLFDAIDWVAPGFEVVQSHLPGWNFKAADTVADGGLHSHLLVGRRVRVLDIAQGAAQLDVLLAKTQVTLMRGDEALDYGHGANVLDSPLRALAHFLRELRACAGAPDLKPGDVVTTGTWTNAWPVQPGERWRADFSQPLQRLAVEFA